jgi:hypothetical protein
MIIELSVEQVILLKEALQVYASHAYDKDMPYADIEGEEEFESYCKKTYRNLTELNETIKQQTDDELSLVGLWI